MPAPAAALDRLSQRDDFVSVCPDDCVLCNAFGGRVHRRVPGDIAAAWPAPRDHNKQAENARKAARRISGDTSMLTRRRAAFPVGNVAGSVNRVTA